VRTAEDVGRLARVPAAEAVPFVFEAARIVRKALPDHVPLIGFAGAPFTLASYLVEGGPSRDFLATKRFMREEPVAWRALMSALADIGAEYLNGQTAAGAQAVQLFDSWVGALSPSDYRVGVLPPTRRLIEALTPGIPLIHFGTGTAGLLHLMREAGGDVIGLDWRVDIAAAWDGLGEGVAVQGNLDPALLLASLGEIRRGVKEILGAVGGRPGHIFNLGHGVLKETPVEHAIAVVDMVHELSSR
jgi:uroporphyrinogen decarboxylase